MFKTNGPLSMIASVKILVLLIQVLLNAMLTLSQGRRIDMEALERPESMLYVFDKRNLW